MKIIPVLSCILFLFGSNILLSQKSTSESFKVSIVDEKKVDICVSLDPSIPANNRHPLMDRLEAESEDYITWFYALNKIWQMDSTTTPGPRVLTRESLIFTVVKDGTSKFDTLNNAVDPDVYVPQFTAGKSWRSGAKGNTSMRSKNEIQGRLPKGSMSFIEAKRNKLECGILVAKPRSKVVILIKNLNGQIVATLCDAYRLKGWHKFKWKRDMHPRGKYLLSYEVDGHLMTQKFKI